MRRNAERLEAVLTEYKTLREELIDKSRLHVNIFVAYLSALVLFYGYVASNGFYDLMIVVPGISVAIIYRIIWDQLIISEISTYIKYEIEQQKIPTLLSRIKPPKDDVEDHKFSNLWLGWQTSYYLNKDRLPPFYERSLVMLFVYISSLPPIVFNIYNISLYRLKGSSIEHPILSNLSIEWNIIFLIMNICITIYTYYLIKKYIMRRREWWRP